MSSKNGVPFRRMLVGAWNYGAKCPYAMDADSVTVHETDNNASANNEASYMIGNTDQVSFHVAIDEKEAVQGIPANTSTVKSHYDRSGKNCPSKMRNDGQWSGQYGAVRGIRKQRVIRNGYERKDING